MGSTACCHSVHSHATEGGQESSSKSELSHDEEDATNEDENAEADKGEAETSSNGQAASDSGEGQEHLQTQDTLTSISQVFDMDEDTNPESDPEEKIQSIWQKRWQPKEDSPPKESSESPSEEELPQMRHSTMRPSKKLGSWTHISMLGTAKRLLKALQAGPQETP